MADLVCLFRVGPAHPWPAWHGDTVRAVGDGTSEEEVNGMDCDSYLDGWSAASDDEVPEWAPCTRHRHHVKVCGPWSGMIPTDGLEPLDEQARALAVRWAAKGGA